MESIYWIKDNCLCEYQIYNLCIDAMMTDEACKLTSKSTCQNTNALPRVTETQLVQIIPVTMTNIIWRVGIYQIPAYSQITVTRCVFWGIFEVSRHARATPTYVCEMFTILWDDPQQSRSLTLQQCSSLKSMEDL